MSDAGPDFADLQGLVRFGYGRLTEAAYALLRVKDPAAARAWLRSVLQQGAVANAVAVSTPPTTALQVAFTAAGLRALELPAAVLAGFSDEFLEGMTEASRSRRLGDVEENDPVRWEWGGDSDVHVVAMFFAERGRLAAFRNGLTGPAWDAGFHLPRWLGTGDLDGREPFGFADGISQPEIDWSARRDPSADPVHYTNMVALGEFVLGYRNEYGRYTDRPLVEPGPDSADLLPATDAPEKRDLGRNGTYLVVRQLRQDVRAFWRFVRGASRDGEAAERLAAAFVGRHRDGAPLEPSRADDASLNEFTFDGDPAGLRCPLGAHVRRANPRNADYVGRPSGLARLLADLGFGRDAFGDDLTSSVRFHRLLRRGREYGPGLSPEDALGPGPPDDQERGLHFVCLNANIARQFEFVQNAWINGPKFSGLMEENDALIGTRPAAGGTGLFTVPVKGGLGRRVEGLPQFVTVRGGAYFFLPSLRALRYLARP